MGYRSSKREAHPELTLSRDYKFVEIIKRRKTDASCGRGRSLEVSVFDHLEVVIIVVLASRIAVLELVDDIVLTRDELFSLSVLEALDSLVKGGGQHVTAAGGATGRVVRVHEVSLSREGRSQGVVSLIVTGVVGMGQGVFDALIDLVAAGLADERLSPAGLSLIPVGKVMSNRAIWQRSRATDDTLRAAHAYGSVRALLTWSGSEALGPFGGVVLVSLVGLGLAAEIVGCSGRHSDDRNRIG